MSKPQSLQDMVIYAWHKSPFYRSFWRSKGFTPDHLSDENFWERVPVLRKQDIIQVSLSKLIGERSDEYHFVSASSGTTEKPHVSLQTHSPVPAYYKFMTERCGYSSILILRRSTYSFLSLAAASKYFPPSTILVEGDARNFDYSADIAMGMGMDHLVATPSVALRFADTLERKGYDMSDMRFLYISGEPITKALFTALRTRYPNAGILNGIGVSEATVTLGHNSSFCESLFEEFGHNTYHLNTDDVFYEIIDDTLTITPLHPAPFPLIKYDTEDTVRMHEDVSCSCGFKKGTVVRVGTRASGASYKIGSVILHKYAIAEALKRHASFLEEDFNMKIFETGDTGRVLLSLMLVVSAKKEITANELETIECDLEKMINILPDMNIEKAKKSRIVGSFKIERGNVSGQHITPPEELVLG
jgi:phenylacetate-coenzyme A ligase PaaK-like adenylate-forming protein